MTTIDLVAALAGSTQRTITSSGAQRALILEWLGDLRGDPAVGNTLEWPCRRPVTSPP